MTPSECFRQRMREVRLHRPWTQQELATRAGLAREVVRDIENGQRGISLDESLSITAALRTTPANLMAPINGDVEILRERHPGALIRAWFAGRAWIGPEDVGYIPAEVDSDAYARRQDTTVNVLIGELQRLLDLLDPVIDPESEVALAASERFERLQGALDDYYEARRARLGRDALAKKRVRHAA